MNKDRNRGGGGGAAGGGVGGGQNQNQRQQQSAGGERPKKESVIDLSKFLDKQVRIKFQGGREAAGKLKGYDNLLNLVLDDCVESCKLSEDTRRLGLVVCRGPAVTVICPQDGHEAIPNPFISDD